MGKVSTILTQHNWRISFPSSLPLSLSLSDTLPGHWDSGPSLAAGVAGTPHLWGWRREQKTTKNARNLTASLSTCQLEQKSVGLIQGPLKSMQIFVLISVALDQHLCTQMKVRGFSHKRTKSCFPFIERKEAPVPPSLLCCWDSPSGCHCAFWLVAPADP